jgi:hypothetical protein
MAPIGWSNLTKLGTLNTDRGKPNCRAKWRKCDMESAGPAAENLPTHMKLQRNAQDGVQAHDWWGWGSITICNTRVGRSTSH